jgi:hypothetical protein
MKRKWNKNENELIGETVNAFYTPIYRPLYCLPSRLISSCPLHPSIHCIERQDCIITLQGKRKEPSFISIATFLPSSYYYIRA